MAVTQTAQACDLVIFGAKGDLARRKLLPSLYQLEKAGQIHPDTRILGVGRADWDKERIDGRVWQDKRVAWVVDRAIDHDAEVGHAW